jgi:hypothetical protein
MQAAPARPPARGRGARRESGCLGDESITPTAPAIRQTARGSPFSARSPWQAARRPGGLRGADSTGPGCQRTPLAHRHLSPTGGPNGPPPPTPRSHRPRRLDSPGWRTADGGVATRLVVGGRVAGPGAPAPWQGGAPLCATDLRAPSLRAGGRDGRRIAAPPDPQAWPAPHSSPAGTTTGTGPQPAHEPDRADKWHPPDLQHSPCAPPTRSTCIAGTAPPRPEPPRYLSTRPGDDATRAELTRPRIRSATTARCTPREHGQVLPGTGDRRHHYGCLVVAVIHRQDLFSPRDSLRRDRHPTRWGMFRHLQPGMRLGLRRFGRRRHYVGPTLAHSVGQHHRTQTADLPTIDAASRPSLNPLTRRPVHTRTRPRTGRSRCTSPPPPGMRPPLRPPSSPETPDESRGRSGTPPRPIG